MPNSRLVAGLRERGISQFRLHLSLCGSVKATMCQSHTTDNGCSKAGMGDIEMFI